MDVEVEDVAAELWTGWLGRRRGGVAGRARRGNCGGKCGALGEWTMRLRRLGGAWRLVDDVHADKRGHRRRTVDRWPDMWWRTVTIQTESRCETPDRSD